MDAVKFLMEMNRMCEGRFCVNCPAFDQPCPAIQMKDKEEAKAFVDTVEKWSKENPSLTNGEVFEKIFGVKVDTSNLLLSSDWLEKQYSGDASFLAEGER